MIKAKVGNTAQFIGSMESLQRAIDAGAELSEGGQPISAEEAKNRFEKHQTAATKFEKESEILRFLRGDYNG